MAELGEGLSGYLDVQDATLRAPRLEAVSNIGIANTAPQHAFSVGSNLYVDTESSNVLTVDGNVVCEGVKVGLIEIIPSYDLAAVSNVGNVTQSTIQFANATTGFVTTANVEVGTANLFVDTVNSRVGVGTNSPVSGLTVSKDIESSNSFITERVLFRETWPNGLNSLVGDLGTWVVTNLNQQVNPNITTTPDGYGIVSFNGEDALNGEFVSPAFDLSDYAIVDGTLQADDKRKTTTRVFMKFWLGTRQLDASNEVLQVQFSPDNGTTWYTVATSQDRLNDNRFTMVSADLSPYILETSTQAKIRFYMPWTVGGGDYMRIGRIWIHESDVPTNLGGMWLGAGGNIGIGTNAPIGKLDVRGAILAPVVSYFSNQDAPYLIAGTSGYTGEATNWDTYGFQHRIKTNSSGVPRITVDTSQAGEAFSIVNNGKVGIGTTNPQDVTHIRSDAGNGVDGLLIEANNTGTGSAALRFGVAGTNETTNVGIPKAGIFFKRSATNGRGDLLFCIDNVDDTSSVGTSDAALKITSDGYVQPGQINTSFLGTSGTGANGSLKGNYLFQGIYNVYRVNGYANTSWNGVYEKYVQVVRMGSLLTIQGYIPLLLTSTTMDLQFTWAELGLDGRRSLTTLINQSTSTYGTWGSATGNATYLTLPSTGHAGNGSVDYNNIKYLIDLSHISNY